MSGRNGQRKPGTTRGSPRRSRTAKASRISRHAVKSRCARGWGGWGRVSDDGPRQHNSDQCEGPWGGGRPTLQGGARSSPRPDTARDHRSRPRGARTADANQISTSECPGHFLAALAGSTLRLSGKRLGMKAISVDLPIAAGFVGIVTLKNRTLSPVARLFIEHAREVAKPLAKMKPLAKTK